MKSVSNIKGLKDRTYRVMNHSRTFNTAITTVFSKIDTLTLVDMFMNCALHAGVRLAGLTCAKTSLPSHCNKELVLIAKDVLNFATFSTIVGMMESLFKCKSVEEDRDSLINICHSLLKTRRLEMELRESHGLSPRDDYPNSTSDQKGSWLDFFHNIITARHISKELIVYHTLRAIKDAASNITIAYCGQYINELNELVSNKGTVFVNFSLHKMESMGGFLNKDLSQTPFYYETERQQPSEGNCCVINDETIKSIGVLLLNKKSPVDRQAGDLTLMHHGLRGKGNKQKKRNMSNRRPVIMSNGRQLQDHETNKTYRNLLKKDQIVEAEKLHAELEIDFMLV